MQIHSIVIQSPLLKKVFETVFEGYPGVTPSLQELQFKSPFIPFFHRMDRLEAELLKPHDVKTLAHVQLLYKTIKGDLQDTQRRLDDLIAHGLISFDLLWTIFNPGDLIFQTNGRHPELYRLKTITVSERYVSLTADYVDWNGSIFGYDTTTFSISEYEGNRRITNLSVYPLIYHADEEGLKERLLKRGKNFVALRGYQYKSYKEIMFLSDNYSNIESLVSKGTRQKVSDNFASVADHSN